MAELADSGGLMAATPAIAARKRSRIPTSARMERSHGCPAEPGQGRALIITKPFSPTKNTNQSKRGGATTNSLGNTRIGVRFEDVALSPRARFASSTEANVLASACFLFTTER